MKKRVGSPQEYSSKAGFFCKLFVVIGVVLLIAFLILQFGSIQLFSEDVQMSVVDMLLAFSILLLGGGVILFFFHCQFAKLAKIAEEIEQEDMSESRKKPGT